MTPAPNSEAQAVERLIDRARHQGADEAEVYLSRGTEFTVRVFSGEVESLVSAQSRGVGLRTLLQRRVGFAYTSDLAPAALDELVDEALHNARYNHAEEANVLPDPQPAPLLEGLLDPGLESIDPQRKVQFALDLERATVGCDPRVKRVSDAVYSDGTLHVELANSRGLRASFDRSVAYGTVEAIAEQDGEMQSGFAFTYGRGLASLELDAAASEAAQNAAGLLGARPHPTARVPVVLHPHAAAMILGVLGNSFSADAVLKRRSLLKDRVGQPVASSLVNIIDDARIGDGLASRPFDGEGTPSRRTPLVSGGMLQRFLHNTYTGKRTGEQSTASAVRSYKSVPEVGVSNLFLEPGSMNRDGLLGMVSDGLHVSQLHGLHTVNPVSGDFSLGLQGHWIRRGQPAEPVREMTIAGNLIGLISRVAAIATDLRFIFAGGFCGSPTILVEELPVAGA